MSDPLQGKSIEVIFNTHTSLSIFIVVLLVYIIAEVAYFLFKSNFLFFKITDNVFLRRTFLILIGAIGAYFSYIYPNALSFIPVLCYAITLSTGECSSNRRLNAQKNEFDSIKKAEIEKLSKSSKEKEDELNKIINNEKTKYNDLEKEKNKEISILISEYKEREKKKDLEISNLRSIINNKKNEFREKIILRIHKISLIDDSEEIKKQVSLLMNNIMAEKTLFESAEEALVNYNVDIPEKETPEISNYLRTYSDS